MLFLALSRINAVAEQTWYREVCRLFGKSAPCLEAELRLRGGSLEGAREFFAPIYPSNRCVEDCWYCGFRRSNDFPRVDLEQEQVPPEAEYLASLRYTHAYCLTGSFAARAMTRINGYGIQAIVQAGLVPVLESSPFERSHLEELWALTNGRGRHTLFMETYHRATYVEAHQETIWKRDPDRRLAQYLAAAQAGWPEMGIGAMLGLHNDVAFEVANLIAHAHLLYDEWGIERVAISVPRLMDGTGVEARPRCSDDEFLKTCFIIRLLVPRAVLVLTGRESEAMRDRLWEFTGSFGVAGSTKPGGYVLDPGPSDGSPGQQFALHDVRSLMAFRAKHEQS